MPLGPPNLSGTAARFGMPATRRRYGPPVLTAERVLADPEPTETLVHLHHWPAPGETIEQLPGGTETTNVREGTTTDDIRGPVEGDGVGPRADSILEGGKEYTVVSVGPRNVGPAGVAAWRTLVMTEVKSRSWP